MAHGLRCLCVRGACCPSLPKQLVILSFFEVSTGTVICCCNSMCTGMYRVGLNVPLKTNRANKSAHVPLCRERVRRTVCGVCAYGARVVHHFLILSFFEVSTVTAICCYNSLCTETYRVGRNVPLKTNRANKYAHVPPCREHECRTVCMVCAYGARVVHHLPSNS